MHSYAGLPGHPPAPTFSFDCKSEAMQWDVWTAAPTIANRDGHNKQTLTDHSMDMHGSESHDLLLLCNELVALAGLVG